MNRESLQESLSAVMDNEADELELRRVLGASDDAEVRGAWSRYQMARAVMHREVIDPHLDIAAAVSAALADEKAPVRKVGMVRGLGRVAVAATVAVAVLAGVRFYNADGVAPAELAQGTQAPISIPQNQAQSPAILAGYTTSSEPASAQQAQDIEGWHDKRLPEYLRQHAEQSSLNGVEGALPYARAASVEGAAE